MTVLLALAGDAWAARAAMHADETRLTVGETVSMGISVDGKATATPQVHAPDGLQVQYVGQSTRTTVINGAISMRVDYNFEVSGVKQGSWTIDPVDVEIGTVHAKTGPLTFTVDPISAQPKEPLTVTATFTPSTAWEGQVVAYEYELKSRIQPISTDWTPPPLDGLSAPPDVQAAHRQYTVGDPQGTLWVDDTVQPLVAGRAGDLGQQGILARVQVPDERSGRRRDPFAVDPFFQMTTPTRAVIAQSDASPLTVKKLPPAPPGFTGLVGDFTADASLDRDTVPAGGTVTWTVHLRGDGALSGFKLPSPGAFDGGRIYDGSPAVKSAVDQGKYESEGTFPRAIAPTREGDLQAPPVDLVVFSPTKGDYETIHLAPPVVHVTHGESGKVVVKSFGTSPGATGAAPSPEEIRPPVARGLEHTPPIAPGIPAMLVVAGLPGAGVMTGQVVGWWRRRPRRERKVVVTPKDRLAALPADPHARLAAQDGALRDALARRVGVDVAALDREAALGALPAGIRERVAAAALALDRARFADEASAAVDEAVREAVDLLERP